MRFHEFYYVITKNSDIVAWIDEGNLPLFLAFMLCQILRAQKPKRDPSFKGLTYLCTWGPGYWTFPANWVLALKGISKNCSCSPSCGYSTNSYYLYKTTRKLAEPNFVSNTKPVLLGWGWDILSLSRWEAHHYFNWQNILKFQHQHTFCRDIHLFRYGCLFTIFSQYPWSLPLAASWDNITMTQVLWTYRLIA